MVKKQGKNFFVYSHRTGKKIGRIKGYTSKKKAVAGLLGMKTHGGFYNFASAKKSKMINNYIIKHKLSEEWVDSIKAQNISSYKFDEKTAEIFKNPTSKEMDEVQESSLIRFIATKDKELYIFNPFIYHISILNYFAKKYDSNKFRSIDVLQGVARKINGKWVLDSSDTREGENVSGKFQWLSKYMEIPEKELSSSFAKRSTPQTIRKK